MWAPLLDALWPTRHVAALAFAIQWVVFALHAGPRQSEHYYDLTGAVTFHACTLVSFFTHPEQNLGARGARQQLVSLCILIWSGRLGAFLFARIKRDGADRRFARIKKVPLLFLAAWNMQGSWVYCVGLPAYLLNTCGSPAAPLGWVDTVGFAVWAIGLALEAIADAQKAKFRSEPRNRDTFICTGLWAISRHPNYLFDIVLHLGLALVAFNGLPPSQRMFAAVAPAFTVTFLTCISGIPPLEKSAAKRWGHLDEYKMYVRDTGVLLPRLSSLVGVLHKPHARRI